MPDSNHSPGNNSQKHQSKKCLHSQEIVMIEEALSSLGDYGEVRLVVEKGRLRFLTTLKSYDALQWTSAEIHESNSSNLVSK
jgi:hypothetical protein